MDVIDVKISDIIPYEKNPRSNDEAVKYVQKSIDEFGFLVPLVIDKNNVIVCGHTRLKAAIKLGYDSLPCVNAENLSEEQIRAFRVIDNKTSENAKWNIKLLQEEIKITPGYNFTDFGFDFTVPGVNKPNERNKTIDGYNLGYFDSDYAENKWGMPELKVVDYVPSKLIGFNYAKTLKETDTGIHFYIDDYQFERIWNSPEKYIDLLSKFECVLTPDFSLYLDMPLAMQIWNIYRSRMVGQILESNGLMVIPTISWGYKESFDFCFDGIPLNSTVSISTIGVKRDKSALKVWTDGVDEMIRRLKPKRILVYGGKIDYDYGNIEVKYYENSVTERLKNGR